MKRSVSGEESEENNENNDKRETECRWGPAEAVAAVPWPPGGGRHGLRMIVLRKAT